MTTVVGLITNNDETVYREEMRALGVWCTHSTKQKEMIVDFRKQQMEHPPSTFAVSQWRRWKASSSSA